MEALRKSLDSISAKKKPAPIKAAEREPQARRARG
jgi:hypothetical protein